MNQKKSKIVINLANQSHEDIFRISQMLMKIAKSVQATGKTLSVRTSPTTPHKSRLQA